MHSLTAAIFTLNVFKPSILFSDNSITDFYMHFPQLLFGNITRRIAHQILGGTAHGERNDLADVLLAP